MSQWYSKKWIVISLHILFWVLFFVTPMMRPIMDNDIAHGPLKNVSHIFYLYILNTFLRIMLFYANANVFIPRFVYKKRYLEYILVILGCIAFSLLWDRLLFNLFIEGVPYRIWNFFVFNILPVSFIFIASTAYRMVQDKVELERKNKERETEHLKTELSFLRSQVSPHFMFNVLNNMVALARKKSDALEPSLIKLSSLLRYMLYETDEDKVPLEKEIDYLQSYIDLQIQRFGKKISIHTEFEEVGNGYSIEPMLLIPFVENAFKHGSGFMSDAAIHIHLSVHKNVLHFEVKNRYNDDINETKDKTSGIGLTNVKRRLELLYDKSYWLDIHKNDGWFVVSLKLNLH